MNGRKLKNKLKKKPVLLPGAYDALGALLIEKLGFDGVYLSGAGLSTSLLGKPDIGLLSEDEVLFMASRMAGAVNIPVLVDVDTGFGGKGNIPKLVKKFEAAGVAGVQIEDQTFPKRCGHLKGKSLVPPSEMVQKIKAAKAARKSRDFLVIARTDARGVTGLEDALLRAQAYKKAGADIIFPEALKTREEFRVFGQKRLGTLLANMTEFGLSPKLTVGELAHLGFRLILFPMTGFRVAAKAMETAFFQLKKKGSSKGMLSRMQTRRELYKLNRYRDYEKKENFLI